MKTQLAVSGFEDGMGSHKPRKAGASTSQNRQSNAFPLVPPERSCPHLDFGLARPFSDFWPQELQDSEFVWF